MTRDQERAQHAYASVGRVENHDRLDYKISVNDLGANIMRSGLAAAIAFLQRRKDAAAKLFLDDLAAAEIPGLGGTNGNTLPGRIRELGLADYMLATRETLKVAQWFKRAVQATFREQQ